MAEGDQEPDPDQVQLPLEGEPMVLVPIRPWQHDSVTTAVMTTGSIAIVAVLGYSLDRLLVFTTPPWIFWTVRIVMGVAFVLTMAVAVITDTIRFALRRWRDLMADWRGQ